MIRRIGYACINTKLKPRSFKECRLSSVYKYGIDYLREKIISNLHLTKDILEWNINNRIFMYRATSSLFPLVTHPNILKDFKWRWQEDEEILSIIEDMKAIITQNDIRLSMHPDQFTVLNSLNESVVENSINNLKYHSEVLRRLGGTDIIIHTGGVYGNKPEAINRFINEFSNLDDIIKKDLRLENDDTSYTIEDVLYISSETGIPVVLDIHHHRCNNTGDFDINYKIEQICNTWSENGSIPKLHISSGRTSETDKRHHDYVSKEDFYNLLNVMAHYEFDLMVEAKKKEEAVLRLMELI